MANFSKKTWYMGDPPGWAAITGASAGIGKEFAKQLAQQGLNLIIIARRKDRLDNFGQELVRTYGIQVESLAADLNDQNEVSRVADRLVRLENLDLLINNAGFGTTASFALADFSRQQQMMQLHMLTPVTLIKAVLPGMLVRNRGGIINTCSLASYIPMPKSAMYSATKSFLRVFSESLALEVANTNVRIQALCPGFTYTEFHEVSDMDHFDRTTIPKNLWTTVEFVVAESLAKLRKNQSVVIPGWKNRILRWVTNFGPFQGVVKRMVIQANKNIK
jgi:short-subunit dehydrogenase